MREAQLDASLVRPQVTGFYDRPTGSIQYVVADGATRRCAIIDPVLDFDEKSGATSTGNADRLLAFISEGGFELEWILDTHPHADHFSAAQYLKEKTGAPTAIGERIVDVQALWKAIYNWPEFRADGSQWDKLFADDEIFHIGSLPVRVLFSPGHTLASITYVAGDAAFIHDTMFMPDSGTARADFPGGSAVRLWRSIQRILRCPMRHASSSVMTINRAAVTQPGKRRSPTRSAATPMSAFQRQRSSSWPCARPATKPCRCRG